MSESRLTALRELLLRSRWFGGKGRDFTVASVRRVDVLPMPADATSPVGAAVELVEVSYTDTGTASELYQVPLAFYDEPQERLEHAHVGQWTDEDFGPVFAYDGVHDRDTMSLWLRTFADPPQDARLTFHHVEGHELDLDAQAALFSGEQSNSSVAFGEDSLMKVFRRVTPGVNPDIAIHEVLTAAGSEHVAALYGWVDAQMNIGTDLETESVVQLAMLQQFLRTASDGFELAKASVRNLFAEADLHAYEVGGDFAGESSRLGEALSEIHRLLADHFPTDELAGDGLAQLGAAMSSRLDEAVQIVPGLEEHADRLRALYAGLAGLGEVPVQRIHGDLHLGQTLRTVKGWKVVDFEGEPAKPLAERMLPDSRWRDVAGMLRSFDYVPAVVERTAVESDDTGESQRAYRGVEWVERNHEAFLTSYAGRKLDEQERLLLAAYVADKAVYEAVYETRNRPTWVSIPLAAIAQLGR